MALTGFSEKRPVLLFGLAMALLLLLLKWLEARFLIIDHALEIYIGSIAALFTVLGIWLANKLFIRTKTVVVEKEIVVLKDGHFARNQKQLEMLGLSNRELEVLELMAEGLSNQEIADRLFVSPNTIKTHNSNILSKLNVKRRTQAVDQARKLGILP